MSCARSTRLRMVAVIGLGLSAWVAWGAKVKTLFSTGFEAQEGYEQADLVGQNGWVGYGSGGNGIVTNYFEGEGQQAFIGAFAPQNQDEFLNVWHPVGVAPLTTGFPVIRFSVEMEVVDSTNGFYDDFRWSVYNTNAARLFTLDFDNNSGAVSYALDDGGGFVATGYTFAPNGIYDLELTLDFTRNIWSATLNDVRAVEAQPISAIGSALNLGDVDAVWAIRTPGSPGDNYMLFDNYTIDAMDLSSIPARLEAVGRLADGRFVLRVHGEPDVQYTLEASEDLADWQQLITRSAPDGVFDYTDSGAAGNSSRFYRVYAADP